MIVFFHAGFMVAGLVLMIAGFAVARLLRKKRFWFRTHRALGLSGSSTMPIGFLTAFYMISDSGGEHFAVIHAYLVALGIFLSVMTPILGQLQFAVRSKAAKLRVWHRRSGAVTMLMVLLVIVSGLIQAGVLPASLTRE